ncbi:hypothetical protein ID866_10986 [Astraeus odoratus]|nr:hypothetical protein ID866_10986 [Astraeus odoratus]
MLWTTLWFEYQKNLWDKRAQQSVLSWGKKLMLISSVNCGMTLLTKLGLLSKENRWNVIRI